AAAEAQAAEANLATQRLRARLAPRQIDGLIFARLLQGQPRSKVEILYLRDDPEANVLALQLFTNLQGIGWAVDFPTFIPASGELQTFPTPLALTVGAHPSGITFLIDRILSADGRSVIMTPPGALISGVGVTPCSVLARAITAALRPGAVWGHDTAIGGVRPGDLRENTVRIVVAPKRLGDP